MVKEPAAVPDSAVVEVAAESLGSVVSLLVVLSPVVVESSVVVVAFAVVSPEALASFVSVAAAVVLTPAVVPSWVPREHKRRPPLGNYVDHAVANH
ncbi:MAG: hypothetical protein R3A51_23455 [Nannocystaceae bacterium]